MSRRGVLSMMDVMVLLVILLILALVLFGVVYPKLREGMASEKLKCEWSMLLSAGTKVLGSETIPPECRAKRFTITSADLERHEADAFAATKRYAMSPEYDKIKVKDGSSEVNIAGYFATDNGRKEWGLDKMLADEIKDCSDKVLKGKLPLFDEWWSLLDCEDPKAPGGVRKCTISDWKSVFTMPSRFSKSRPPQFCVLCSRIIFDKSVRDAIGKQRVMSLKPWMAANPISGTAKSYLEYASEWQTYVSPLFANKWVYDTDPNTPLAIIYKRINRGFVSELWDSMLQAFGATDEGGPLNQIMLLEYRPEVIVGTADTRGECDWILD